MFGFTTGQRSTSGEYRDDNQDSLYASRWSAFVADGVGGHAGGDVASATVTIRIAATLDATNGRLASDERLRELIAVANSDLTIRTQHDPQLAGLATTLTGVFSDGESIRIAHLGDSRAYRVRDGEVTQMTRDDSLVQDMVDSGKLTAEEAKSHPYRSVVMNVLTGSADDAAALHITADRPQLGDRWLLTSDGLTDYVPEAIVFDCLTRAAAPQDVADLLVETAVAMQARDNVSVIVADVVELTGEPPYEPVFGGSAALDPASARTL
jgi:serine/threonine protein phosphatase PrpC